MYRRVFCHNNLRTVVLLSSFVYFFFTACGSRALAGENIANPAFTYTTTSHGSTPTHRSEVDTSSGQVYVYVGGALPAGARPVALQYRFDLTEAGNTSGFITPLLFESTSTEAFTIYTVVGIGKSFEVHLNSFPQTIPFNVIEGVKVPTNRSFTFGFINATVASSGTPILSSPGAVDFDSPADSGEGTAGTGTTNDWGATATSATSNPVVALGTTFGASGAPVDFTFLAPYRTYSAEAFVTLTTP
jgi:hypothetical protein